MIVCLSVCNRVKRTLPVTKLNVRRWEAVEVSRRGKLIDRLGTNENRARGKIFSYY